MQNVENQDSKIQQGEKCLCGIVSILHFYTNILDKGTDRGVSVQIEVMRSGKENVRDN